MPVVNDYYGLLGVRRDADADEIKKAYRRLARELHPDVNPDPQTQERFKEITQAYEVLSDPEKRQMYDLGADPFAPGGAAGAGGFGAAGFPFSDIMDAFFGGGAGPRGPRSRARRGRNATIRVELDLSECAFGTTRDLVVDTAVVCPTCSGEGTAPGTHPTTCEVCNGRGEVSQVTRSFLGQVMTSRPCPGCGGYGTVIRRPCPECDADGRVRTRRTIKVRIPAGVEDGTHIQLAGEGETGPGGGPPGDLFLEIVQRPHPIFERQGDDLHCTVTIPMVAAALGATLQVETLDGPGDIDIRPGTQTGQAIPLYGQGTAPGTHPTTCEVCNGRGEVSQVTRSFLGEMRQILVCPGCGGYGTIIPRPCHECDGDGRVRTRRTIKVRIPAGVEDGTHIQLAGEGEVGPGGGPPGDLFLEVVQRPHDIFERQGDDLHCTVTIPMVAAALGATLSVDSLDGPADIDIRPGTQSGQVIPLYGQGVKHLNGNGRGDLVIHVTVETPTRMDAEQEKLLRELSKLRGEESPPGKFAPGQQGFFSRLRDAFNGR